MTTGTVKTISRTATKKVAAIKAKNLRCWMNDSNSSNGSRVVDPQLAWNAFDRGAKLVDVCGSYYTVQVHCNLYFKLTEEN